MFSHLPRSRLATLPTPLERGPELPGGVRLWMKRDDLTGLGMGGNKARKLEFLCGAAVAEGARSLVTVGAQQSNHCRMTAAAGAVLGLEVHLVLAGDRPEQLTGNLLLSELFGAQLHFTGADATHWGELEIAREALSDELTATGAAPYGIPIGGSTAVGAAGYAHAFAEILDQCGATGIAPAAVVHTTSSGGTHAGLVAGRAIARDHGARVPEIVAIGVAKGVNMGMPDVAGLAADTVELLGGSRASVDRADVTSTRTGWRRLRSADPCRRRRDPLGRAPRGLGSRSRVQRQGVRRSRRQRRGRPLARTIRRDLRPHGWDAVGVRPRWCPGRTVALPSAEQGGHR